MYEVEFTNKNLIITDPCYLDNVMNKDNLTDGLRNYWDKFCNYLHSDLGDLSRFGFTNGFACGTKYGDWSCTLYNVDYDPRDIKTFDQLMEAYGKTVTENNKGCGEFCADAGMVCVVDSEEIQKFNPYFFEWAMYHKWCVAGVHNFTGTVGVIDIENSNSKYRDVNRILYGVAKNPDTPFGKNFITFQTGY